MQMTSTGPTLVAPCGCEFAGRFVDSWSCTYIAPQRGTITGSRRQRHQQQARKAATPKES